MFPGTPYGRDARALDAGDLVVMCTDGILEAANAEGDEFGLEGLEAVVRAHREASLDTLASRLWEALDAYTGGAPLSDDRTLVMLRRLRA